MNILFLDAYFKPEATAYSHIEDDLIDNLINDNNNIFVVCPIPTRGISDQIIKKYKSIKQESKCDNHLVIRRFWAPQENKSTIARAFRYVWCNLRSFQIASKMNNIDVVFCNSTPPTQGIIAGMVAGRLGKRYGKKIPFVFNLQDIFPDSLVNAKMTKKGSLIWKIGRVIENRIYKSADHIITISDNFSDNIIKKGVDQNKISVIHNWIDTADVYSVKREENILFDKLKLDRELFYICYSGNVGLSQNMDLLIKAAKKLQSEITSLRFIIIGDGVAKESIKEQIEKENIKNIKMFEFQPYENIADVFSLGDVGLVISKAGIGNSSVPSKTWSILAASRPVLASFDSNSELNYLINKYNMGLCSEADDVDGLIENIRFLFQNREEIHVMGENGLNYVKKNISKDKCVEKYLEIIKRQ